MTDTKSEALDWTLWFYWIIATTVGWLTGSLFSSVIPIAVSGFAIAALQGLVLYKRIQKAWRWIVLSSLGWISAYIRSPGWTIPVHRPWQLDAPQELDATVLACLDRKGRAGDRRLRPPPQPGTIQQT